MIDGTLMVNGVTTDMFMDMFTPHMLADEATKHLTIIKNNLYR